MESLVERHIRKQQLDLDTLKTELHAAIEVFVSYVSRDEDTQFLASAAEFTFMEDSPAKQVTLPSDDDQRRPAAADIALIARCAGVQERLQAKQLADTSQEGSLLGASHAAVENMLYEVRKEREERMQLEVQVQQLNAHLDQVIMGIEKTMSTLIGDQLNSSIQSIVDTINPIHQVAATMISRMEAVESKQLADTATVESIGARLFTLDENFDKNKRESVGSTATLPGDLLQQVSLLSSSVEQAVADSELHGGKVAALQHSVERAEKTACGMVTLRELREILNRERLQRNEELPSLMASFINDQTAAMASLEKRIQTELSWVRDEFGLSARTRRPSGSPGKVATASAEQVGELARMQQIILAQLQREVAARQELEARMMPVGNHVVSRSTSREGNVSVALPPAVSRSPSRGPSLEGSTLMPLPAPVLNVNVTRQRSAGLLNRGAARAGGREGSHSPVPSEAMERRPHAAHASVLGGVTSRCRSNLTRSPLPPDQARASASSSPHRGRATPGVHGQNHAIAPVLRWQSPSQGRFSVAPPLAVGPDSMGTRRSLKKTLSPPTIIEAAKALPGKM